MPAILLVRRGHCRLPCRRASDLRPRRLRAAVAAAAIRQRGEAPTGPQAQPRLDVGRRVVAEGGVRLHRARRGLQPPAQRGGGRPPHYTQHKEWLAQLIQEAATWQEPGTCKPYWSAHAGSRTSPAPMDFDQLTRSFVQLVEEFEANGYLTQVFGQECVDNRDGPPLPDRAMILEERVAMPLPPGRWRIPEPAGSSTTSVTWSRSSTTSWPAPRLAGITTTRAAAGTTALSRLDPPGGCTAGKSIVCWPPAPSVCGLPRTARTSAGSYG
jgi:hypothetical protein